MIRISGAIPIKIQPFFWLTACYISWMFAPSLWFGFLAVGMIFSSVLVHEYGHALLALLFHQRPTITLGCFGGSTSREGERISLGKEFLIVFAGPCFGGILAGLCYAGSLLVEEGSLSYGLLRFGFMINTGWTLLNLIPVQPLDGGHLLSIVTEWILGVRGLYYAQVMGVCLAVGIAIVSLIMMQLLLGSLFAFFAWEGFRSLKYYRNIQEEDRDEHFQERLQEGVDCLQEEKEEEAEALFKEVREKTGKGILFDTATEYLAALYRKRDELHAAYELLLPIRSQLSNEGIVLFHGLAYHSQEYALVRELARRCYEIQPSGDVALINALAYAVAQDVKATIGWLECAFREGVIPTDDVFLQKEFGALQGNTLFEELRRQYQNP